MGFESIPSLETHLITDRLADNLGFLWRQRDYGTLAGWHTNPWLPQKAVLKLPVYIKYTHGRSFEFSRSRVCMNVLDVIKQTKGWRQRFG